MLEENSRYKNRPTVKNNLLGSNYHHHARNSQFFFPQPDLQGQGEPKGNLKMTFPQSQNLHASQRRQRSPPRLYQRSQQVTGRGRLSKTQWQTQILISRPRPRLLRSCRLLITRFHSFFFTEVAFLQKISSLISSYFFTSTTNHSFLLPERRACKSSELERERREYS